ncbi:ADP-ribosylarginine hydrolase CG3568 isoform X2 [Ptiloglossa arizonensis]|uniref:ADP-ribosylarginine hydrolase CG3568 isoform X2 n=1 Tax=Ptiloglossa arizonensis TaxID=3350558 RepID=UPI003F9FE3D0
MSLFACCIRRNHRRMDESRQQALLKDPPEISWENTLGAPNGVPLDDDTKELLRKCLVVSVPTPTTLAQIIKRSEAFPIYFPINTTRCSALKDRGISTDVLEMNANSVYPLIHEAMLPLLAQWLKHKQLYGSAIERAMYMDMGLVQFIHRLLEKRAVHFYGSDDRWKLIDGKTGVDGWENVGTDNEKEPLVLTKCLSYDEIKLSAMLAMSSHTEFINDGSRENRGVVSTDPDSVQPRGVIIGVVGTRFEKPRVMEYQDILVTPLQNTADNGYGPTTSGSLEKEHGMRVVWARFYGEVYLPLYEEAVKRVKSKENRRYLSLSSQTIFDIENYMKRTLLTVEIILLEANTRAEKQNTTAFLHVVGFGLGVWRIIQDQEVYFLKTFEIAIRKMNKKLRFVSDIMFAYFSQQKCGDAGNGDYLGDIKIHFALREPHSRLFRSSDANKLLVVTYAWDGNALPGNEFWSGFLASSGDPAAACSSQVAELHTARINPRACGASLHVASAEYGILHISDYAKIHLA